MYLQLTIPLLLITPGHRGLVGSKSGPIALFTNSVCPSQGLFIRCGDTNIHSPFNGLYLL